MRRKAAMMMMLGIRFCEEKGYESGGLMPLTVKS